MITDLIVHLKITDDYQKYIYQIKKSIKYFVQVRLGAAVFPHGRSASRPSTNKNSSKGIPSTLKHIFKASAFGAACNRSPTNFLIFSHRFIPSRKSSCRKNSRI